MSGDSTTHFNIPYLAPSQSQPSVTIDAALDVIDEALFNAGGSVAVSDTSSPAIVAAAKEIKFVGATVSHETNGVALVTIDYPIDSDSGGGVSSDSGASPIDVTDGTTTVSNVSRITFDGATVAAESGGGALVTITDTGGGGGGSSGANVTADTHPATANAMDDEFEGTSLDTKWTVRNGTPTVITLENGNLLAVHTSTGANALTMITQAAPATPYKVRTKLTDYVLASGSNFLVAGLIAINSVSTNLLAHYVRFGALYQIASGSGNSLAAEIASANPWFATAPVIDTYGMHDELYLEIENDGTNLIFRFSASGLNGTFSEIASGSTPLSALISSVTDIGIVIGNNGATSGSKLTAAFDWFRRVA